MVPVILEGDFSIPPLSHQYHWFLPPIFWFSWGKILYLELLGTTVPPLALGDFQWVSKVCDLCALPSLPPENFRQSVIFVTLGSVPPVPLSSIMGTFVPTYILRYFGAAEDGLSNSHFVMTNWMPFMDRDTRHLGLDRDYDPHV
ncbi:hypothetical protein FB451DRAFT_1171304 [Mycena latifolia]|nr:hypothetical protein FB451DRAFT_1171304 [Mycena latifolia]